MSSTSSRQSLKFGRGVPETPRYSLQPPRMNIDAAASLAMALSQQKVQTAAQTSMLKQAMNRQEQGMAQLLAGLPQPAGGTPPAAGQSIDVRA